MNFVGLDNVVLNVNSWNPVRDGDEQLIYYIDLSSIDQQSKTIKANESIVAKEAPSRARQLVKRGDVLVSTVRPNLNGVAMVDEILDGATASTGFCVLRPNQDKLDGSYLFHWVKSSSFVSSMVQQATGASYPAVSDRIVKGSKIPLPPIDQQKRIAAILDKAEELRSLRRQSIEQLDILGRSIFIEMFGDPIENPKKWIKMPFGEVCIAVPVRPRYDRLLE
jgi:type I restriction enzyme, S subunit